MSEGEREKKNKVRIKRFHILVERVNLKQKRKKIKPYSEAK